MPGHEESDIELLVRKEEKVQEPEEYRVILLNDNYTTMEFVIKILMSIFHKSPEDATLLMLYVHHHGRGTIGVYPWDIAQTKVNQVHSLAQRYEFPCRCIVEKA
jgi:ATP-dependent Clp protease adaptor protein ClpS